ncbi:LuxR C-terminal-related transcriptional regulator [Virgibacillus salinus]|uniref:AAA domain-containing protein n=1 Tax=Virgibacillus salinus TaxID=553311 RepID=A0A1H0Z5Q7_9BACI|nr:LuxR C-terminal-related transcriptional regulator [Virgibacillus salinus]SDQ22817.1 AAA domain-containing protein [Virgibacillus salinus]
MEVNDNIISNKSVDSFIQSIERDFFIGRTEELEFFYNHLNFTNNDIKVLYIHGTGGVGKTYLLNEYNRISNEEGLLFLKMDSRDFPQTPEGFADHILTLIETHTHTQLFSENYSLRKFLHTLSELASDRRIIIAIDSYEHMDALDRWFRQVFIQNLPSTILVIMAGRHPLSGEWVESPAWRSLTKEIELKDFSLAQTRAFLDYYGIDNSHMIKAMWKFTDGHPLTLTLAALTDKEFSIGTLHEQSSHILMELTQRWLLEVKDESLHRLIEVAALFFNFDQSSLSAVLKEEIDIKTFNALTSLSFVKPVKNGWAMHDLVRDAIKMNLKLRHPERFEKYSQRSASFFYKRTITNRSPADAASFFYHLGDEFIRSVFFQEKINNSMYLEPIADYNFHEVSRFFENRKSDFSESEAQFYNRETNESYHFHASFEHNRKEMELIDDTYVKKINYKDAHLLKNKDNKTLGLSIIVPINVSTLKVLAKEPVSRAYFSRLNDQDTKEYSVPENENAGWFIRFLDYTDSTDTAARSFMLYNLFPLLLTSGRIIVSTPLPFFQDLLENFGFQKIPEATHYDYGENYPSTTYILDVRGPRLANYLKQLTNGNSVQNEMEVIATTFSLTEREVDIVTLILEEKGNAAIAKELYVAEITVKKHITRIFKKMEVKNRSQLIKCVMEIIS